MIGCYTRAGELDVAFSLYDMMRHQGVHPNPVTVLGLLSGVLELVHLQCLHACVIRYGFGSDLALANSLLNVYCKCGRVEDAHVLFELMEERDVISWNSLVSGYAQVGNIREVMQILIRMKTNGIEPDEQTFVPFVSTAAMQNELRLGKLIHGHILRAGLDLNSNIETSLIGMYLKCRNVSSAFRIFEGLMHNKDVFTWSAMISGLVQNDCADMAIAIFQRMVKSKVMPSTATISSVLAACAELGSFSQGASVHGYILRQRIKLDVPSQNSLVTMYAKCGHLEQSCSVFDRMSCRDRVSWNAIVSGHAQNGHLCKALLLFNEMRETLQRPDSITFVSLLQACAAIGALHQGKWIHSFVTRSCLGPCISIDTALVDMYSKCGDLGSAQKCFNRMPQQDLVSWSSIIAGYGSHGKGETALKMYNEFLLSGIRPNHVIYLLILSACSHNGLVSQGLSLFHSMTKDWGIEPRLQHRACVVDLLSRAGRVEEAYDFYKRTFLEPSMDVLGMILDACRKTGNVEVGDIVGREIVKLNPENAENYVQLSHSYASMKKWDGVGEVWNQMKSLHLKKQPGWSFIELNGTITTFFTHHSSHPQFEEIMLVLKFLGAEMTKLDIHDIIIPSEEEG